jgi:hypothetical protein
MENGPGNSLLVSGGLVARLPCEQVRCVGDRQIELLPTPNRATWPIIPLPEDFNQT